MVIYINWLKIHKGEIYLKKGFMFVLILFITIGLGGCSLDNNMNEISELIEVQQYEQAHDLLMEILDNDDENVFAYETIIYIYDLQKENEKIVEVYEKYKDRIDSNYADVQAALRYWDLDKKDEAANIVNKIDIDTIKEITLFEGLVQYYEKAGNIDKAIGVAEKGLEYSDRSTILHGFIYGLKNEENLFLLSIDTVDINGDGNQENILLLSNEPVSYESEVIDLVIQDGNNGRILGKKELHSYGLYQLEFADLNQDGAVDMLIKAHGGGTAGYFDFMVYSFKNNNLTSIIDNLENDLGYIFMDGFKAEVFSEQAQKSYLIEFDQQRKERYIEDQFYDYYGTLLDFNMGGFKFPDFDIVYVKPLEKYGLKVSSCLAGPSYNADIIATIETLYVFNNGKWTIVNMTVSDEVGLVRDIEFNKYKPEIVMSKDIEFLNILFNMTMEDIYKEYGQPLDTGYYQTKYLEYRDRIIFIDVGTNQVSSIWLLDGTSIFDIDLEATYEDIIGVLGNPQWEDYDGELGEYTLYYEIGKYSLYFNSSSKKDKFYLMVK